LQQNLHPHLSFEMSSICYVAIKRISNVKNPEDLLRMSYDVGTRHIWSPTSADAIDAYASDVVDRTIVTALREASAIEHAISTPIGGQPK